MSIKAASPARYSAVSARVRSLRVKQKGESVSEEHSVNTAAAQKASQTSAARTPAAARHAHHPPGKGTPIQQAVAAMKRNPSGRKA